MAASRYRLIIWSLALAALLPAGAAGAAKTPLPPSTSTKAGTFAPGGSERLVTRRSGEDTLVAALRRRDSAFLRSRTIRGRWRVAPVAFDGATTGLSANGRVLVLVRPERRFPPTSTRLAVLDARTLAVRREIPLAGFFTLDAVSPDGRWAYLVQYANEDVLDYRVRALDTGTGRLAARDVVDPRSPAEQMGGLPMTRATSHDGRWAYTLYGGGEETFIHALDTASRTAACIDLEMLASDSDLTGYRLRVSADGKRIDVRAPDRSLVASVDARTFAVSEPGRRAETAPAHEESTRAPDGGGFPLARSVPRRGTGRRLRARRGGGPAPLRLTQPPRDREELVSSPVSGTLVFIPAWNEESSLPGVLVTIGPTLFAGELLRRRHQRQQQSGLARRLAWRG